MKLIYPCWHCGHYDSHDLTHARGCPRLPPVPKEDLLRIARNVEAGWAGEERRDGNGIMSDDERDRLELQAYSTRVLDEMEDRLAALMGEE
jgi:hypothetical protein